MLISLNGSSLLRKAYPNWFKRNTFSFCLLQEYKQDYEYAIKIEQDRALGLPIFLDQCVAEKEPLSKLSYLVGAIRKLRPKFTFVPDSYIMQENKQLFLDAWKVLKKINSYTKFLAIPHGNSIEEVMYQVQLFTSLGIKGIGLGSNCDDPNRCDEKVRSEVTHRIKEKYPNLYIHFLGLRDYSKDAFEGGYPDSLDTSSVFSQGLQCNTVKKDGSFKIYKHKSMYKYTDLSQELNQKQVDSIERNLTAFWNAVKRYN